MIIFFGTYHWFARVVGFRVDYCRTCEAEVTSVQIRTLDVFHIFWIPVLPYGRWSRWRCGTCGRPPHVSPRTRRGFKIAGVVILVLMTLSFWFAVPEGEVEPGMLWAMRIGLPVALFFLVRSILRHRDEPDFKARLAAVQPHSGHDCLLCGGTLAFGAPSRCEQCEAQHKPL